MRFLSPAKINLFLKVRGKRKDSYHNVETLMSRISLYDILDMSLIDDGIDFSCANSTVPKDERNITYRAANLFLKSIRTDRGVRLHLTKKIPVASGLGGGSSNAASVLVGLNKLLGCGLSDGELMKEGAKLGADVPFFIFKRPAIARGIGDELQEFHGLPKLWFVLVHPRFQVSTRWTYNNLKLKLTRNKNNSISHMYRSAPNIAGLLANDLEAVTITRYPVIKEIKGILCLKGAEGALMSGSGPAVFGFFFEKNKASRVYEELKSQKKWDVFLAHSI